MKKYVILDIDRTIINGTSWYYACMCPDLLMDKSNVELFSDLNEKLFNGDSAYDKVNFRKKVFDLMNRTVSDKSYKLLLESGCASDILPGQFVDDVFYERIGTYTLKKLISADEYCKKVIKLIFKYYTGNIEIIFLTSGYKPFMKGLVSLYMQNFDENITWKVVGSELDFIDGEIEINKIITQTKKYEFINSLFQQGDRVVFLADDSTEEKKLFEVVRKYKGYAFNVKYDRESHHLNWKELYEKSCTQSIFIDYLMNNSEVSVLNDSRKDNSFYYEHCNDIGILSLSHNEFIEFMSHISDKNIRDYVKKMIYQDDKSVYLRGNLYYYWLPPYITMSFDSKYIGWEKLFHHGVDLVSYLSSHTIENNKYSDLVIYMACDHLLATLYLAIYCMEKSVLAGQEINKSNYECINDSIKVLNQILYSVLNDELEYSYLSVLNKNLDLILVEDLRIINDNEKFLLELDNYQIIFMTVHNIISQLGKKVHDIDQIVYFAYGGIALGYAFQAAIKMKYEKHIKLFSSHYSSKRYAEESNLVERIPMVNGEETWKDSKNVLLLDNNVTTFKTLRDSKNYLQARNNKVYCAVTEVDYSNIYNWLFERNTFEIMCKEWYEVIDIKPTDKYISAYNTWGTSQKSSLLESIYLRDVINWEIDNIVQRNICSQHRKICRVHNIYDLQVALKMGATMIGIHAVINRKDNYYDKEQFAGENGERYPDLPVPDYEVESIKYMIAHLPASVTPVLVIENELTVEKISKILELYGLDIHRAGIQIQFNFYETYIQSIIKMGFAHIIASVGIVQSDIRDYIRNINSVLRESSDFILIDMSKHQPQMIMMNMDESKYSLVFETKFLELHNLINELKQVDMPILLADDINPDELILCQLMLLSNGIRVVGLDMQNNIEVNKEEQGYCKIREKETNNCYYAKIRKSIDKIRKWETFESSIIRSI